MPRDASIILTKTETQTVIKAMGKNNFRQTLEKSDLSMRNSK